VSKSKVLFLCTGNSCRSQIAEGLVGHYLPEEWLASSAGTEPVGYVHPLAIRAMAEIGIDISGNVSKSVELFRNQPLALVVIVCDSAAENCPVWLGQGNVVHIEFPDPAKATGADEEKMQVFRSVRDDIQRRILHYLTNGQFLAEGQPDE
jgi:arsenate reductase